MDATRGLPPRLGILLGPARAAASSSVSGVVARASTSPARSDENRLDAARADVESEEQRLAPRSAHSEQQLHRELVEPLVRVALLAHRVEIERLAP